MWIPDGVHGRLRGTRGRVAVIVGEEIPQLSFFGVEIQLKVNDGWVVGGGAGMIVVKHLEIIERARRGEPRLHRVA